MLHVLWFVDRFVWVRLSDLYAEHCVPTFTFDVNSCGKCDILFAPSQPERICLLLDNRIASMWIAQRLRTFANTSVLLYYPAPTPSHVHWRAALTCCTDVPMHLHSLRFGQRVTSFNALAPHGIACIMALLSSPRPRRAPKLGAWYSMVWWCVVCHVFRGTRHKHTHGM